VNPLKEGLLTLLKRILMVRDTKSFDEDQQQINQPTRLVATKLVVNSYL